MFEGKQAIKSSTAHISKVKYLVYLEEKVPNKELNIHISRNGLRVGM